MTLYSMDVTMEELELILSGLSDDGKIGKEAEKALLARIEEGKSKNFPIGEVKRQLRWKLNAEQGKRVADAVSKLW